MDGPLKDSSPDTAPTVWLCTSTDLSLAGTPDWMTIGESERLAGLSGGARRDFLASRWLIRHALATATGCEARQCMPAEGRPTRSAYPAGWQLSLSHSGSMAGCAISCSQPIGLDIEPVARRPNWQKVVSRWFSPQEQGWLLAEDNAEAFLRVWTLKEAWLKATGRGIANNLRTLEVSPDSELSGDRPGWRAAQGLSGDYLVTVIYQQPRVIPEGFTVPGPIDINNPGGATAGAEPITWTLHRDIHCSS